MQPSSRASRSPESPAGVAHPPTGVPGGGAPTAGAEVRVGQGPLPGTCHGPGSAAERGEPAGGRS
eukprot:1067739-Pyramimonas_sp.AAC.1